MEAGKFKVLGNPGKIKAVGELMKIKHEIDNQGHQIAQGFYGVPNSEKNPIKSAVEKEKAKIDAVFKIAVNNSELILEIN